MSHIDTVTGQDLREMFSAATSWLEKSSAEIDALNVFPVPDGDTGTNMLLTMRSTMEEAYRAPDHSASGVAHAMARPGAGSGRQGVLYRCGPGRCLTAISFYCLQRSQQSSRRYHAYGYERRRRRGSGAGCWW